MLDELLASHFDKAKYESISIHFVTTKGLDEVYRPNACQAQADSVNLEVYQSSSALRS
jgi:hypothetical protein